MIVRVEFERGNELPRGSSYSWAYSADYVQWLEDLVEAWLMEKRQTEEVR